MTHDVGIDALRDHEVRTELDMAKRAPQAGESLAVIPEHVQVIRVARAAVVHTRRNDSRNLAQLPRKIGCILFPRLGLFLETSQLLQQKRALKFRKPQIAAVPDIRKAAVRLPAPHISNLDTPRAFSAALHAFLVAPVADALADGFAVRRSVLGDAHVDRAVASTTPFTAAFQDLITRYAWGTIWTRPGLDPRTRRLLVLAMTAAAGRWEEFRLHVRTGLGQDLEPCDLEEVLLQVAVYAGAPAANTAFHIASEELGRAP